MKKRTFNPQAMINLDAMWEAAGRPKGKEPWHWLENEGKAFVFGKLNEGIGIGHIISTSDPKMQEVIDRVHTEWRATSTSQWNYDYAMRVEAAAWEHWSSCPGEITDADEFRWLEYLNEALDKAGIHTNRWAGEYPNRFPLPHVTPTA